MSLARVLGVSILLLSACAPDEESARQPLTAAPAHEVYYTLRPDLRLCIWPACGGVWLHAVNSDLTQCADGNAASECYVSLLESNVAIGDVTTIVVHGTIVPETRPDTPPFFALRTDQVWEAVTSTPHSGPFWLANGHAGSFELTALNNGEMQHVHGIDFTDTGATNDQIQQAINALAGGRLIIAGVLTTGADGAPILKVSQFYQRIGSRFDNVYDAWLREVQK
jgi:uncharacterized protein DUF6748